jgi:Flp pilus assembly pilin Flp
VAQRFARVLLRAETERGQALVEYALILGLVTVVAVGALTALGANVNAFYDYIQSQIASVVP